MKVFVDTNVFIASITDEPGRGDVATELLNENHDFCTSILNLMEVRSVLTKKKRVEQERVEEILADIYGGVEPPETRRVGRHGTPEYWQKITTFRRPSVPAERRQRGGHAAGAATPGTESR